MSLKERCGMLALVAANGMVRFAGQRREEVYGWVERTLVRHEYAGLRRPDKGLLRLYLAQMTGLSRAQVTRLITGPPCPWPLSPPPIAFRWRQR
jgi:hypothetical protein